MPLFYFGGDFISEHTNSLKHGRVLDICLRLMDGDVIRKTDLATQYGVTERSIQRDIDDLRSFFADRAASDGAAQEIIFDRSLKGYRLRRSGEKNLTNGEALAVCKILLESRSLRKDELAPILDKIIKGCVPYSNRPQIEDLIANEKFYYIEPHHGQHILPGLWEIGQAVHEHRVLEIEYERMKEPKLVHRQVWPVGIMFSEYYFYLTAFLEDKTTFENPDDLFPTIYRLDRIKSFRVLNEYFKVPYKDRFQEGEFRKRIQFMYGGELERVNFKYSGPSIEAVLDRLPTARILRQDTDGWIVEAEVFGKGIEMWLRSQGTYVNKIV